MTARKSGCNQSGWEELALDAQNAQNAKVATQFTFNRASGARPFGTAHFFCIKSLILFGYMLN